MRAPGPAVAGTVKPGRGCHPLRASRCNIWVASAAVATTYRGIVIRAPPWPRSGAGAGHVVIAKLWHKSVAQSCGVHGLSPRERCKAATWMFSLSAGRSIYRAYTVVSDTVRPWTRRIPTCGPRLRRSEEHTSELQSRPHLVCRLLLEKKKKNNTNPSTQKKKKKTNK